MTPHARYTRAVDAHFAGRASRAGEAELRAHLPDCPRCRRRYDRHLLLARLDPRAPSAEDRLAAGLGFPSRSRRAPFGLVVGASLAAAVALVLVAWPPRDPQPRGPSPSPALLVYRVGAKTEAAGPRLGASDELAFAYSNPGARRYLLVYAEDEHGHVYWFHPGWPAGAPPPSAVPARAGAGPFELPEAIRHRFDGRRLRVTAILTDARLGVGAVERDGRALQKLDLDPREAQIVTRTFEVTP